MEFWVVNRGKKETKTPIVWIDLATIAALITHKSKCSMPPSPRESQCPINNCGRITCIPVPRPGFSWVAQLQGPLKPFCFYFWIWEKSRQLALNLFVLCSWWVFSDCRSTWLPAVLHSTIFTKTSHSHLGGGLPWTSAYITRNWLKLWLAKVKLPRFEGSPYQWACLLPSTSLIFPIHKTEIKLMSHKVVMRSQ